MIITSCLYKTNEQSTVYTAYIGTNNYMSIILVGTVLSNSILTVFWGMGNALKEDMDAGVLESNWLTPVSRLLILVGRTLTSLLTTAITSLVMLRSEERRVGKESRQRWGTEL